MTDGTPVEEKAFYDQMTTCRPAYRLLAECIYDALDASHTTYRDGFLDLGCGLGFVGQRLGELGLFGAGVELSPEAITRAVCNVMIGDLREPLGGAHPADVVICTETAEHVEAVYADAIVDNCVRLAKRVIIWSAAHPGQEWPGHINLQPASYWLEKFAARHWIPSGARTNLLRRLMRARHAQHEYCAENFFVLVPQYGWA